MLQLKDLNLARKYSGVRGAKHTASEIAGQPKLWRWHHQGFTTVWWGLQQYNISLRRVKFCTVVRLQVLIFTNNIWRV